MNRKTIRANLRAQIRALKTTGASYDEIGAKVLNNGKPIGRSAAQHYAGRQDNECRECLRVFKKASAT